MKLPIIIGGSPRAGKTTLAENLSKQLNLKWLSTDSLRKDFRLNKCERQSEFPNIFSTVGKTAEEFWETRSPQDVMNGELRQAYEFWPIIKSEIVTGKYDIVEGILLLPELIWSSFQSTVNAIFIIDRDEERIQRTISQHGLWSNTAPYADWVKKLEFQWVLLHNEWYKKQMQTYSQYLFLEVKDRTKITDQVLSLLN